MIASDLSERPFGGRLAARRPEETRGRQREKSRNVHIPRPWTGREKLTPKKRKAARPRGIAETTANRGCEACRGGDSSQDHPQISRTRPFIRQDMRIRIGLMAIAMT